MKYKMLIITLFIVSLIILGNMYVQAQTGGGVQQQNQMAQQTQQQNQGEDTQIQNQTQQPEPDAIAIQAGQQQPTQKQEPVQPQTGTPGKNEEKISKDINELRWSKVAKAVHELLSVADRVGGIGEQVREIAKAQQQNQDEIEASVEKIEKQNKITTFLIGPNHGEINKAAKLTMQNEEKIAELKDLQAEMTDQTEIQKTTEQIQTLEKANLEVKDTLEEAQKTFSLFGWLRKLFSK